ncbi:MAG: family 10 glycosylhydrolase [Bacilli bacterium]|nr:family 10 glycosylhydrolase [Bacilli bacterium]
MKKIVKPLLFIILLVLTLSFAMLLQTNYVKADAETVAVVNDDGTVVTYRGSEEEIMRLKEYNYPTQSLKATWASLFVGSMPAYSSEEKWKSDYTYLLDTLEEYGLNCIVFHVRTHNNALYKSELNPIAKWMSSVDFDTFDPIAWAIEETHKRSIEFHAWLNPYRVATSYCAEDFPSCNPASNPDNLLSNGTTTILNPGIPEVQEFLVDTCMELVENYDVDAIHFDDYFYISNIDDSATMAKYNTDNLSTADFRRQSVDKFIEDLSKELRAYNTNNGTAVQLGISPSGVYLNGGYSNTATYNKDGSLKSPLYSDTEGFAHFGNYLYADTLKWINKEWIDYIMPQAYNSISHEASSHAALSRWWSWAVKNRKVNLYMGMGIYLPTQSSASASYWQKNKYEIRDQILNAATHEEVGGYSLYSYNFLRDTNTYIKTGMDILKNDWNTVKIPCDVKKYYENVLPVEEPIKLCFEDNKLSWETSSKIRGYIVYRVPIGESLDKSNINQIYYYGNDNSIEINDLINYDYYVAAVNLANVISDPIDVNAMAIDGAFVKGVIDDLADVVSLDDGLTLSRIQEFYDLLSDTEKAKVSNYAEYQTKQALYNSKVSCHDEASNYAVLSNYAKERRTIIEKLLKDFNDDLISAKTISDSENLLANYKQTIDSYPLADVELKEPRDAAIQELQDFYDSLDKSYYLEANQNSLISELAEAKNNINKAMSKLEITSAKNKGLEKLNSIADFKDKYDAELAEFKEDLSEYANKYLENNEYVKTYKDRFNAYVESLFTKVQTENKEEFIRKFADFYNTYCSYVDAEVKNISSFSKALESAISSINSYTTELEGSEELKAEYITKLKAAATSDEINSLLEEFNTKYSELNNKTDNDPGDSVEPEKKLGCKSGMYIISLFTSMALIYFILKRKH